MDEHSGMRDHAIGLIEKTIKSCPFLYKYIESLLTMSVWWPTRFTYISFCLSAFVIRVLDNISFTC